MVADKEETRATKSQVWINGALSTKVPPYKTRGINSGGDQFISTRTDYSMAYKFGTNQNSMMHGLISLRSADLRKTKLRQILRRLLRRYPHKDHSTN